MDSSNGLMPDDTKPLSEPMTSFRKAHTCHMMFDYFMMVNSQ